VADQRRYLFVGLDYGGTWKPMLGLAGMLMERGHAVTVLGAPFMRARAETAGCAFISLPDNFDDPEGWAPEDDDWVIYSQRISGPELAFALAPAVEESGADAIVFDCLLLNAMSAAECLEIPSAVIVHFLWYEHLSELPNDYDEWIELVNATREQLELDGLPPATGIPDLWDRMDAILSLPPPAWTRGRLPENALEVGPIANEPKGESIWTLPWPADDDTPLIVISLSSSYMHQEDLLERLAAAASGLAANTVLSLAGAIPRNSLRVPKGIEVVDWLNFQVVLPHADLLVTHGGQATVSAGMRHGIPLLICPLGRDQSRVGGHVEEDGTGILLDPNASLDEIREAMTRLLDAKSGFNEAASIVSEDLRSFGDGRMAVEALEALRSR
jgi:UDP:flavonoid glycosyltransferase YjiC (YdhE family)